MNTLKLLVLLVAVVALVAASSDSDKDKLKKLEKEIKKLKEKAGGDEKDALKKLEKEVKKLKEEAKKKKKDKMKVKVKDHDDDDKLYCYCGEAMKEQYARCDTFYDERSYTCFKLVNGNQTVKRGAMNADKCNDAEEIKKLVKDNLVPLKGKTNDVHLHCCRRDYCNAAPQTQRLSPLALAAGLPLAGWLLAPRRALWN